MKVPVPSVRVAMLIGRVTMHELSVRMGDGYTVDRLRKAFKGETKTLPANFVELVSRALSLDCETVRIEVEAARAAYLEREAQAA